MYATRRRSGAVLFQHRQFPALSIHLFGEHFVGDADRGATHSCFSNRHDPSRPRKRQDAVDPSVQIKSRLAKPETRKWSLHKDDPALAFARAKLLEARLQEATLSPAVPNDMRKYQDQWRTSRKAVHSICPIFPRGSFMLKARMSIHPSSVMAD